MGQLNINLLCCTYYFLTCLRTVRQVWTWIKENTRVCVCVCRLNSSESSLRFSTWLGRITAFLMTPLISWILWLWYDPSGLDRIIPWWCTAGTDAVPVPYLDSVNWCCYCDISKVTQILLQRGNWTDRGSDYHGDRSLFNGVWPASVSSRNCQDHERPEGHDDPDACMSLNGFYFFLWNHLKAAVKHVLKPCFSARASTASYVRPS